MRELHELGDGVHAVPLTDLAVVQFAVGGVNTVRNSGQSRRSMPVA